MVHLGMTMRSIFGEDPELTSAREVGAWDRYEAINLAKKDEPMPDGPMLGVLRKLQALIDPVNAKNGLIQVTLFSKGGAGTAHRALATLEKHGLTVCSAIFTDGGSRIPLVKAMNIDMMFTTSESDARRLIAEGIPSAKVSGTGKAGSSKEFFVLFDVDAVLVDDSSEKIAKFQSIEAFQQTEKHSKDMLKEGPIAPFAKKMCRLRSLTDDVKLGILTARSPVAHRRVLEFFQQYGIEPDFQAFMGGQAKGPIAAAVGADILLDDHHKNCQSVEEHGVLSGHVLFGVNNPEPEVTISETDIQAAA